MVGSSLTVSLLTWTLTLVRSISRQSLKLKVTLRFNARCFPTPLTYFAYYVTASAYVKVC